MLRHLDLENRGYVFADSASAKTSQLGSNNTSGNSSKAGRSAVESDRDVFHAGAGAGAGASGADVRESKRLARRRGGWSSQHARAATTAGARCKPLQADAPTLAGGGWKQYRDLDRVEDEGAALEAVWGRYGNALAAASVGQQ